MAASTSLGALGIHGGFSCLYNLYFRYVLYLDCSSSWASYLQKAFLKYSLPSSTPSTEQNLTTNAVHYDVCWSLLCHIIRNPVDFNLSLTTGLTYLKSLCIYVTFSPSFYPLSSTLLSEKSALRNFPCLLLFPC